MEWLEEFKKDFYLNFIKDDRWKYIANGLGTTIKITVIAILIGLVIGITTAVIRATYAKEHTTKYGSFGQRIYQYVLSLLNFISHVYITVIRGTPTVIQLLIIYFVVFASVAVDKTFAAIIAFSINTGAYISEIVRGGIMSVDNGQFEAGRSLGFGYIRTMIYIVMPQAFKNVLPALGNEFIVLLKETSISGYIALEDLTKGADIIRSRTYDPYFPLLGAALIYLLIVSILSLGVNKLERRLRQSER